MQRIKEISPETMGIYADYIKVCQTLFNGVEQVINEPHTPRNLRKWNELFYRDIKGERYTSSMADPAYMNRYLAKKRFLSVFVLCEFSQCCYSSL